MMMARRWRCVPRVMDALFAGNIGTEVHASVPAYRHWVPVEADVSEGRPVGAADGSEGAGGFESAPAGGLS
jgi:hypothetical protein